MGIFAEVFKPQNEKQPTPDEVAQKVADEILLGAQQNLAQFVVNANQLMQKLWANQLPNITASMIAEKLGLKGVALFSAHANISDAIIKEDPDLAEFVIPVPEWAKIEYELVDGVPTGRVIISKK